MRRPYIFLAPSIAGYLRASVEYPEVMRAPSIGWVVRYHTLESSFPGPFVPLVCKPADGSVFEFNS